MVYDNIKRLIEEEDYNKKSMLIKLDVFLKGSKITKKEYNELVKMMG